jgi:hypothetical protein
MSERIVETTLIVLAVQAITLPLAMYAGSVGSLTTFANGTVADADQVNANFAAVQTAVDDNDARIPDFSEGTGMVRIGDVQICWGTHSVTVGGNTNNATGVATLPTGCVYTNTSFVAMGSSQSNYGNANNNIDLTSPNATNRINVRCQNTNPSGSSNTAGNCVVSYVTFGNWR